MLSKKELKSLVEDEVKKLHWEFKVEVNYEIPESLIADLAKFVDLSAYKREDIVPLGTTYAKESDGVDKVCFQIDGFVTLQKKTFWPDEMMKVKISEFVRHEWRHMHQFMWLRKVGGSDLLKKVLDDEINAPYGQGVLENDAMCYQVGNVQDFEEVFAKYIAA